MLSFLEYMEEEHRTKKEWMEEIISERAKCKDCHDFLRWGRIMSGLEKQIELLEELLIQYHKREIKEVENEFSKA